MDAGHLAARFLASAAEHAQRPATRVLAPDADQSETPVWRVRTYAQLAADVR